MKAAPRVWTAGTMGAPDFVGLPRAGCVDVVVFTPAGPLVVVVFTRAVAAGIVAAAILAPGRVVGFVAAGVVVAAGFVVIVATVVAIVVPAGAAPAPGRRFAVEPATVTPVIVLTGRCAVVAAVAAVGAGFTAGVGAGRLTVVVVVEAFSAGVGAGFVAIIDVGGAGLTTVATPGAFVVTGFVAGVVALATCFGAVFGATATAPDSSVEAVTRPELEPPVVALRNDQPGFAVLAAANACRAGLTAAGTGFLAGAGVGAGVGVGFVGAGGVSVAFGPEETTGRAAVVRSMRSALVGGSARDVAGGVAVVAVFVVAIVVAGFAVVLPGFAAEVGGGAWRFAATVTP